MKNVIQYAAALVIGIALGTTIGLGIGNLAMQESPIPACTDQIAVNGGICQGPITD